MRIFGEANRIIKFSLDVIKVSLAGAADRQDQPALYQRAVLSLESLG